MQKLRLIGWCNCSNFFLFYWFFFMKKEKSSFCHDGKLRNDLSSLSCVLWIQHLVFQSSMLWLNVSKIVFIPLWIFFLFKNNNVMMILEMKEAEILLASNSSLHEFMSSENSIILVLHLKSKNCDINKLMWKKIVLKLDNSKKNIF